MQAWGRRKDSSSFVNANNASAIAALLTAAHDSDKWP